ENQDAKATSRISVGKAGADRPLNANFLLTKRLPFRDPMAQNLCLSIGESAMNLRTWAVAAAAGLAALTVAPPASAANNATKDEAVAMVKKAVSYINDQGADKAYPEISNRTGQFVDRDLYVVVYQLDGKVLAHGGNQTLVGKD